MHTTVDIRHDYPNDARATIVFSETKLTDHEVCGIVKTLTVFCLCDVPIDHDRVDEKYNHTSHYYVFRNSVKWCKRETVILVSIKYSYSSHFSTSIRKTVGNDVQAITDELTTVFDAFTRVANQY